MNLNPSKETTPVWSWGTTANSSELVSTRTAAVASVSTLNPQLSDLNSQPSTLNPSNGR